MITLEQLLTVYCVFSYLYMGFTIFYVMSDEIEIYGEMKNVEKTFKNLMIIWFILSPLSFIAYKALETHLKSKHYDED